MTHSRDPLKPSRTRSYRYRAPDAERCRVADPAFSDRYVSRTLRKKTLAGQPPPEGTAWRWVCGNKRCINPSHATLIRKPTKRAANPPRDPTHYRGYYVSQDLIDHLAAASKASDTPMEPQPDQAALMLAALALIRGHSLEQFEAILTPDQRMEWEAMKGLLR